MRLAVTDHNRLPDRLLDLRDWLLKSPVFQRYSLAFPLTRWIARREAHALFDLCAGFVYAQALAACVQLRVFERLAEGPRPADRLASEIGLSSDAATRLFDAAIALRLLDRRGGSRIGLGPRGAALLGNPGVARMVEHHALFYRDLADPVALLRSGGANTELSRYWAYTQDAGGAALGETAVASYSALMGASQPMITAEILAAYDLRRHRRLLDIGGGDGVFALSAAEHARALHVTLLDLPAVAARAAARFAASAHAGRLDARAGDFRCDALPAGADLVTLVRVLHDHPDAAVQHVLGAVRQSLPPGGRILIAEPMAGGGRPNRAGDAYFGFYLLAMGKGRPRTPQELTAALTNAGFSRIRLLRNRTPMLTRILIGEVPSG